MSRHKISEVLPGYLRKRRIYVDGTHGSLFLDLSYGKILL